MTGSTAGEVAAPAYLRVARAVERAIATERLGPGERVESERALAERFGISRMTARRALEHLTRKGVVEARGGRGTYVAPTVLVHRAPSLTGFTEETSRQGAVPSSRVLFAGTVTLDEAVAAALDLGRGARAYRLSRLRLADASPVAIETTEIPIAVAPGLEGIEDVGTGSLYALLRERFSVVPTRAEQSLSVGVAGADDAARLDVETGAAVLAMTRLTRDADGRPIEHARSLYRADAFLMKIDLDLREDAR